MPGEFKVYTPLNEALSLLRSTARPQPRPEVVPLAGAFGRVLFADVTSRADLPIRDSSHMDGFAIRSSDVVGATPTRPVTLRLVPGVPLGRVPSSRARKGEARAVLTGGFLPLGADAVVQSEQAEVDTVAGTVKVTRAVEGGEFVFPRGRDIRKGETVLKGGRTLRASDLTLLATLHMDRVRVYKKPRVAIIPTGNELSPKISNTEPGKVVETHSVLLSRLIACAGGLPVVLPIARDELGAIERSVRRALGVADVVLTLAGSSVGDPDLTGKAISNVGSPGVIVHGMKVFRGRVMGFGAVAGKVVVILPGPVQGAVNAFALMAYPVIRSYLGRGFEAPPSVPAVLDGDWEVGSRYPNFSKVVYAKLDATAPEILATPSKGETEKITHLTTNDGYILVGEDKTSLRKGERVRVYLLPGLLV